MCKDWQQRSLTVLQSIVKAESSSIEEIPRTLGELQVLHGPDEAAELISKGWFDKVEIRGITHYIKTQFAKATSVSKKTEETMTMKKVADRQDMKT